jgi:iron complex outermembrane receptor protein
MSPMAGTSLTAAYTWMPTAEVTKSSNPDEIGKPQSATSKHTLSLWADHRFGAGPFDGSHAGLGLRYASSTLGEGDNAPATLPTVTLVDLMLGYDIERWRLALNVRNLTDKTYLGNCGAVNCYYGSARTVVGTVAYRY